MSYLTYYIKDLFNGCWFSLAYFTWLISGPLKKTQSQIPLPNNWIIIAGLHYSMQNASSLKLYTTFLQLYNELMKKNILTHKKLQQ